MKALYLIKRLAADLKTTAQKKRSFPLRISSVMSPNPKFPADLVKITEKILNGKLQFLCREDCSCLCYLGLIQDVTSINITCFLSKTS